MIKCFSLLLFLVLLIPPAVAQQVSQPTPATSVTTNAVLTASSTVAFPNGVWRNTFSAGSDAPPLFYRPSASACTLNAGNGDSGFQVKSSDGKCWLAAFEAQGADARQWGVVFDGGAIDNTTALTAALNWSVAQNGVLLLPSLAGCAGFASPVALTLSGSVTQLNVVGASRDGSCLIYKGTGTAWTVTLNNLNESVHLKNWTLTTSRAGGANGLAITQTGTIAGPGASALSELQISIHSDDGFIFPSTRGTHWFTTALSVKSLSNVDYTGLQIWGNTAAPAGTVGLSISGTAAAISVIHQLTAVDISYNETNLLVGDYVQQVMVNHSTMIAGLNNIKMVGCAASGQFSVNLTALNPNKAGGSGILDTCGFFGLATTDNYIALTAANSVGINLQSYSLVTLKGDQVFWGTGAGSTGIFIGTPVGGTGASGSLSGEIVQGALAKGVSYGASAVNIKECNSVFSGAVISIDMPAGAKVQSCGTNAWNSYVPTLACLGGSLSSATASGFWHHSGPNVQYYIVASVTTLGTCTGAVTATLPIAAFNDASGFVEWVGSGREFQTSGKMLQPYIVSGGTVVNMAAYDNTLPAAPFKFLAQGEYRIN